MKISKLWLVTLPLFTMACSEEYTGEKTETSQTTKSFKTSESVPDNPYDRAGEIYSSILYTLDHNNFNLESIEQAASLIDSISKTYPELDLLAAHADLSKKISDIKWILNNNDTIDQVISVSTLSQDARHSLCLFVKSLIQSADDPDQDDQSMILSYQQSVQSDERFSGEDKQIMLTAAAVVLNSVERKRKDKDWETSVTKMTATVLKADQNIVLSLKMALTVRICQKNSLNH